MGYKIFSLNHDVSTGKTSFTPGVDVQEHEFGDGIHYPAIVIGGNSNIRPRAVNVLLSGNTDVELREKGHVMVYAASIGTASNGTPILHAQKEGTSDDFVIIVANLPGGIRIRGDHTIQNGKVSDHEEFGGRYLARQEIDSITAGVTCEPVICVVGSLTWFSVLTSNPRHEDVYVCWIGDKFIVCTHHERLARGAVINAGNIANWDPPLS